MTQAIEQAVRDILTACRPQQIILYAEKRTMATDKLKAFSLCVIVPDNADCRALQHPSAPGYHGRCTGQPERLHNR